MPSIGNYVELDVANLDEGDFAAKFQEEFRRAYVELERYEKASGDTKGKVKLTATLTISRSGKEHFEIGYEFGVKSPKHKHETLARGAGGRLLADSDGGSLNDRDQMEWRFDRFGNRRGQVNPKTGEQIDTDEDESPAGKVGFGFNASS